MEEPPANEVSLAPIPGSAIETRIHVVRERQVMLDADLADLYGVETRRLIEQVKRNIERFPADFMFQLSRDETRALREQLLGEHVRCVATIDHAASGSEAPNRLPIAGRR